MSYKIKGILKNVFRPLWHLKLNYTVNRSCYNKLNQGELIKYKNKHNGERCFIIGNGPSLSIADLEKLKYEHTFAANSIYVLYDRTDWRTSYYFCQDSTVLRNNIEDIKKKITSTKFIKPTGYSQDTDDNAICFNVDYNNYKKRILPEFSEEITENVKDGYTVTYSMIQFACYMGFKEIYLLGVDFNYIMKDNKIDEQSYPDKRMGAKAGGNPDLEYNLLAYQVAKKYADDQGIKIFNATRGGMLEVFPRVDLDDVLGTKERE
ncbi:6-hydroxymethylpterin diphosphokinase MptE-like protein [Paenibacillus sp. IHB B 3415]|uniref:6-hydroxymethylpterin diphosphokinase MptE-like protein n=1 Tax=Paenibacillus sp. IHB B 3415 TaxID=867080 RepID=UPI000699D9DB|nr:6-hydroxymethylpterin diphosphokinase MptE-like protein [Paenibacillus sp. IHB B 3415]